VKASIFGERLAYARWWRAGVIRREGDTEFAERLGVSGPALSQWRDRAEPLELAKCEVIAELCEVPLDWLQRGERATVSAPDHFARFLPAYRDWVRRGGLVKSKRSAKLERSDIPVSSTAAQKSAGKGKRAG
jgi:transcriptional regulator with XRE-family HTH domain